MTDEELRRRIESALGAFFAQDAQLLERNVAEPAIAGALAGHLRMLFPKLKVDLEYNRHGLDPKSLDLPPECRGGGRKKVLPDIVVHRRGIDDENLVAIEVKKETNGESRDCDRAKLRAMRQQLQYRVGVLVDLPAGPGATARQARLEWF